MNLHTIILNLDRSKDRKEAIKRQFEDLNISTNDYTFFPAFDGKNIINMGLSNITILKGAGLGRKLQIAELAVIMSHIGALKHCQIMKYDNVIILEDDVVICKDWTSRLDKLFSILPTDWEYVYLSGHSDYVKIPMYNDPTVIKAPHMIGAFAYMANKIGIEKLIKYCGEFVTTYDDMIMHKIQGNQLNGYLYLPFMVYHAGKESLLWDKTPGHLSHINNMHSSYTYFKDKL